METPMILPKTGDGGSDEARGQNLLKSSSTIFENSRTLTKSKQDISNEASTTQCVRVLLLSAFLTGLK